jgi:hypothetical protein
MQYWKKNMVVVAAAGNTNAELQFFPASYDHVVSVANTTMEDVKAPGATYSYKVTIRMRVKVVHHSLHPKSQVQRRWLKVHFPI